MEQNFSIGAMKAEAMRKAFGIDLEKGRTGVYEDNAENRRLNRVGQHYGHKKEEEPSTGKQSGKSEQSTGQEHKTSAATMESAAQGASDEALKRASADPKAAPEVKAAAEAEMKKRGGEGDGGKKEAKSSAVSEKKKVLKDFKSISSKELWNMGFDSGDAKEIYWKDLGDKKGAIVLVNQDDSVVYDEIDGNVGEYEDVKENLKEYKSFDEFASEVGEKLGDEGKKEIAKEAETVKKDSSSRGKTLKDFKSVSSSELWNAGYDSGDAKEIYLKSSEDKDEVVLVQEDGSVVYSVIDTENGEEDFHRFNSFDELEKYVEENSGGVKKDMKPKELVSAVENELNELINKEGVHNDSPEWRKGAYEIWKKYKEAYPNFSKLKTAKNFDSWFTGSHQGAAQGIKMKAYLKARDAGKTHEEGEKAAQDEYDAVMRYINRR